MNDGSFSLSSHAIMGMQDDNATSSTALTTLFVSPLLSTLYYYCWSLRCPRIWMLPWPVSDWSNDSHITIFVMAHTPFYSHITISITKLQCVHAIITWKIQITHYTHVQDVSCTCNSNPRHCLLALSCLVQSVTQVEYMSNDSLSQPCICVPTRQCLIAGHHVS